MFSFTLYCIIPVLKAPFFFRTLLTKLLQIIISLIFYSSCSKTQNETSQY